MWWIYDYFVSGLTEVMYVRVESVSLFKARFRSAANRQKIKKEYVYARFDLVLRDCKGHTFNFEHFLTMNQIFVRKSDDVTAYYIHKPVIHESFLEWTFGESNLKVGINYKGSIIITLNIFVIIYGSGFAFRIVKLVIEINE